MTDVSAARDILGAFSDLDGLTRDECDAVGRSEGWSPGQCEALVGALGPGPQGRITSEEQTRLLTSGFHSRFVALIAGTDGFEALRRRVDALASCAESAGGPYGQRHAALHELDWIFSPILSDAGLIGAALAATAGPHLAQIVTGDANPRLRDEALEIMASHPALRSLSVFMHALSDSDLDVRVHAVSALSGLSDPSVIPTLRRLLHDSEPRIRRLSATALGARGSAARSALPDLIDLARSDEDPEVRARAVRAIARIRP